MKNKITSLDDIIERLKVHKAVMDYLLKEIERREKAVDNLRNMSNKFTKPGFKYKKMN